MSELLWLDEEELREACRILATKLCLTEHKMLMMAMEMKAAVEYGYRIGYEDGVAGESFAFEAGDEGGLVLH